MEPLESQQAELQRTDTKFVGILTYLNLAINKNESNLNSFRLRSMANTERYIGPKILVI